MKPIVEEKLQAYCNTKAKSIWSNKDFVFLFIGSNVGNLTFHVYSFMLPIYIYNLTNSSLAMSTMRAVEILPTILLGMFIGVLVDRVNRKKIMIMTISIQILVISLLMFLIINSLISIYLFYIIGFALYLSKYTFGNTSHAILPLIIEKTQLTQANSAKTFMSTFLNIIGPTLASLIMLKLGVNYSLIITLVGLSILFCFVINLRLPTNIQLITQNKVKREKGILFDIKEGWIAVLSSKTIKLASLIVLSVNLANSMTSAIFIFYALDNLKISISELALVSSFGALGGLLGALFVKKSIKYYNRGSLFIVFIFIMCVSSFIFFISNTWIMLAFGRLLADFSLSQLLIHYKTIRQEETPNELLGRVAGTTSMALKLIVPISFILAGWTIEYIDGSYIFLISFIYLFSLGIVTIFSPIITLK
ncbi:MFS transporter [Bacillus sp. FJAT-27245]|uniref:MFS transporter n=1 Tax=Bacillus sp. FJAT-27245 TaxID=1684144 RepID=UPI0006A7C1C9|nr:MFS transporter [Bacillus sp. FJAT-27245]